MRTLSAELKLAFLILVVSVATGLAGARVAGALFERAIEDAGTASLRGAADAFAAQERAEIEKLAATLDALLASDRLRQAFVARDRDRLLEIAEPLFRTMRERDRITHWYFIEPDPDRRVFLRVHRPELRGDRVARITLAQAAESRDLGAGKELGRTAFALRAVRPWFHEGKLVGYMELAEEIDHFLTALKVRTGDEYGLLVKKRFLDEEAWTKVLAPRSNTWNDRPDVVVVDATAFTDGIMDYDGDLEALPDRGLALDEAIRRGRAWVRGIFPVRDAAGRKVGGLFVLHDITRQHDALREAAATTYGVLAAIGVASAAIVFLLVRLVAFRRLERLRHALDTHADAAGLPPSRVVPLRSEDEIGRLERLFHRVLHPGRPGQDPEGAPPGAGSDTGH